MLHAPSRPIVVSRREIADPPATSLLIDVRSQVASARDGCAVATGQRSDATIGRVASRSLRRAGTARSSAHRSSCAAPTSHRSAIKTCRTPWTSPGAADRTLSMSVRSQATPKTRRRAAQRSRRTGVRRRSAANGQPRHGAKRFRTGRTSHRSATRSLIASTTSAFPPREGQTQSTLRRPDLAFSATASIGR
jgi:hypothetical protein